jgi:hypothetical protein
VREMRSHLFPFFSCAPAPVLSGPCFLPPCAVSGYTRISFLPS